MYCLVLGFFMTFCLGILVPWCNDSKILASQCVPARASLCLVRCTCVARPRTPAAVQVCICGGVCVEVRPYTRPISARFDQFGGMTAKASEPRATCAFCALGKVSLKFVNLLLQDGDLLDCCSQVPSTAQASPTTQWNTHRATPSGTRAHLSMHEASQIGCLELFP